MAHEPPHTMWCKPGNMIGTIELSMLATRQLASVARLGTNQR